MSKVRVLIVEDSPLTATLIQSILENDADIEVVGIATDGEQAIEMVKKLKPNVITMDVLLPTLDGIETTKRIMGEIPTPILILSTAIFTFGQSKVFQALAYGALEVMEKTFFEGKNVDEQGVKKLQETVKMLARVKVIRHPLSVLEKMKKTQAVRYINAKETASEEKIIGLAASTGGTVAILSILKRLPKDFKVPIIIVQHITIGFERGFADWLNTNCEINVCMAEDGARMLPGNVYVAYRGKHIEVTPYGRIKLVSGEPVESSTPSGTVLLKSIAENYGDRACGIILSGMGKDGAEGLKQIHNKGGYTLAQEEKECVVFGMPKKAIELGAVSEIANTEEIAKKICVWANL